MMRLAYRAALGTSVLLCVMMTQTFASAGPASCELRSNYSAKHFYRLKVGEYRVGAPVEFYNWDFEFKQCAHHDNVEWPVDLIFTNHAKRKIIKAGLEFYFEFGHPFTSKEWARINDGAGTFWANDTGKKTLGTSEFTSDSHYRIYAYSEQEFSLQWGYFVIGTMHKDYNEPGDINFTEETHYGNSEGAEEELYKDAETLVNEKKLNWIVERNAYNTFNEEYNTLYHHKFVNDGLATVIKIP